MPTAGARTSRPSRSCSASTGRCTGSCRDRDVRRGVDRVAGGHRADRRRRLGLRLQVEPWADARHVRFLERTRCFWSSFERGLVGSSTLQRELRAAALARRGRARKRVAARTDAGRRREQFANVRRCYAHMWAHPARSCCSPAGSSRSAASGARKRRSTGTSSRRARGAGSGEGRQPHRAQHAGAALARLRAGRLRLDLLRRRAQRVVAYVRWDAAHDGHLICVVNFSGAKHANYRIGVPRNTVYREVLNTDGRRIRRLRRG